MKTVWVTGGGTGIGRALVEHFYRQGDFVVMSGRRVDVLEKASAEITTGGDPKRLLAVAGDICETETSGFVLHALGARKRSVDLLINNAGWNPHTAFDQTTIEEYLAVFRVNCLGAIQCTKAVLPGMRQRGMGTIVNIASVLGKWASSGSPSYSISKYAVSGFTDVLRQELAGTPIHVLGVYPGFIRTDMTLPHVASGSVKTHLGKTPEQMAHAIARAIDLRQSELHFPWYVPWMLRLHRWMPSVANHLARRVRH